LKATIEFIFLATSDVVTHLQTTIFA